MCRLLETRRAVRGLLLAALLTATCAGASPFNVDCAIGWQGRYRPLEWNPVEVDIFNTLKEPLEGQLELVCAQDNITSARVCQRLVLTPGAPQHVPLVVKIADGAAVCGLRITDSRGRTRWEKSYDLSAFPRGAATTAAVSAAACTDLLIVTSGRRSAFGLHDLPKASHSTGFMPPTRFIRGGGEIPGDRKFQGQGQVIVAERLQRQLPWDWIAYSGADLLILYDADWDALAAQQSAAIVEWVLSGGKVLLVLGVRPLAARHPIASLLPFAIGPAQELQLPKAALDSWGCHGTTTDKVACWEIEGASAAGWRTPAHSAGRTLFAWGRAGFGRVGVLAFDPAVLGGAQQENLAPFWIRHVTELLDARKIESGPAKESQPDYYDMSYAAGKGTLGANAIMNLLLDVPQMQPIGLGWVILLLLGLAVVIGPVDYFVLKRRDRFPWTWTTFGISIAVFSVVAYCGVDWLRAGSTTLRAVSVVDGVQGRPEAWNCCYSGVFAARGGDYCPGGLRPRQWWSSVAPTADWYYRQRAMDSRAMVCAQQEGANVPTYLPVSVWSMQCLMCEERAAEMPIAATVEVDGVQLRARIENRSAEPITRGYIRLKGDRLIRFGAIEPGGSIQVEGQTSGADRWDNRLWRASQGEANLHLGPDAASLRVDAPEYDPAFFATGNLTRTDAIESYLDDGAAVVCAMFQQAATPYELPVRKYGVVHQRLARLVVPATSERRNSHD